VGRSAAHSANIYRKTALPQHPVPSYTTVCPPTHSPTFAASAAVVAAAASTLRVAARRCAGWARRQPITRCAGMLLRLPGAAARCGALLGQAFACSIVAGFGALCY
jgi:hypothetical protein